MRHLVLHRAILQQQKVRQHKHGDVWCFALLSMLNILWKCFFWMFCGQICIIVETWLFDPVLKRMCLTWGLYRGINSHWGHFYVSRIIKFLKLLCWTKSFTSHSQFRFKNHQWKLKMPLNFEDLFTALTSISDVRLRLAKRGWWDSII